MTSAKSEASKPESQEGTSAPVAAAPAPAETKARRSRRWKNAHRIEKGVTKAARRVSDAISEGVQVWVDRRDASAGKKKDGALRDLNKNLGKAVKKTLRKASKAPADLFDAVAKVSVGKGLRVGRGLFR